MSNGYREVRLDKTYKIKYRRLYNPKQKHKAKMESKTRSEKGDGKRLAKA